MLAAASLFLLTTTSGCLFPSDPTKPPPTSSSTSTPTPAPTVTPPSFSFVGNYFAPTSLQYPVNATIVLTLNGNGPVTLANSHVGAGPAVSDLGTGTCHSGLVMSSGNSCTVKLRFTPQTTGLIQDTYVVRYTSAAQTTGVSIALNATSDNHLPNISLSSYTVPDVIFGSSSTPIPILVTNNGNKELNPATISFTSGTQYAISSTTCGPILAAGDSCTLNVVFTPSSVANGISDNLVITDGVTSRTFNFSGNGIIGPATQLVLSGFPAAVTAGQLQTVTVTAKDVNNNVVLTFPSIVTLASSDSSAVIEAPKTLTSGVGTFNVTLKTAGTQSLSATGGSVGGVQNGILVGASTAHHLAFTTQPSTPTTTDTTLTQAPVVTVQDLYNNTVSGSSAAITLTPYSDSSCTSSVASGITATSNPLSATSGVASFANVTLKKTTIVRVGASSLGLTSACSSAVVVNSGAAFSIAYQTQPSATNTAGTNFATQPVVRVLDSNGNVKTDLNTGTVSLSISSGSLSGSSSASIVNGVANFSGVKTNESGTSKKLTAAYSSFSVLSNNFNVNAAAYNAAQSGVTTSAATVASGSSITATLTTKDAYGNLNPSGLPGIGAINFTSSAVGGTGTFSGLAAAGSGVYTASFTGSLVGAVTLGATISGVGVGHNASVTVTPASAIQLFLTGVSSSVTAGATQTLTVTAKDSLGNIDTGYSGTVTVTSDDSAAVIASPSTLTNGVGTFSVSFRTAGTFSLQATDGTISQTQSGITVSPAALSSLEFDQQPSSTANAGDVLIDQPVIHAYDAYHNLVSTSGTPITLTAHSDSTCSTAAISSGITASSNPVTLSSGVATFSGVQINSSAAIRLKASDGSHSVCSDALLISASGIASLAFSIQPSATGSAGVALTVQPKVTAYDSIGNIVTPDSSAVITLSAHSDSTCSTAAVAGALTASLNPATLSSGQITFAGVTLSKTEVVRLKASDGVHSVCSNALSIAAGAASLAESSLTVFPTSVAADGSTPSTFTITLKDLYSNPIVGQSVTLSSSRGATDTIATSPSITDASGVVTFNVTSNTTGNPTLTSSGGLTYTRKLLFLSETPLVDFQSRYAKNALSEGDTTVTSSWKDLAQSSSGRDLTLVNFPTPNTAWAGDGTAGSSTSPYRLSLSSSRYLRLDTDLNAGSDFYFQSWVRPSSATTRGSVILSNGNSSNKGIVVSQSQSNAGAVQLKLGSGKVYSEEVMSDSPSAYWRLSESSGSTATDFTTHSVNGAYTGGVTLSQTSGLDSDSNTSIQLNGSTGYVNLGTDTFNSHLQGTVEAWVYPTTFSDAAIFSSASDTHISNVFTLGITTTADPGNAHFTLYNGNPGTAYYSNTSLALNQWYHVVWTSDGIDWKIYVNGSEETLTTILDTGNTGSWFADQINGHQRYAIGASRKSSGVAEYFNGRIDEVSIYNSALSSTQVSDHYAARTRPVCHSTTLLANSAWSSISGVYDSSSGALKLFINGTQECSLTLSSPATRYMGSDSYLGIGAHLNSAGTPTAGTYWAGDVGELRFSNSAPSNPNVISDHNASSGNYP